MRRTTPSEHQEQCAVIDWWRIAHKGYKLPEYALFAIPNGSERHAAVGAKLKSEGVRRGIPDLFLAVRWSNLGGLFIEMKRKPNKLTEEQYDVGKYLEHAGYRRVVAYSADEAIAAIKEYLG